MKRRDLIRQLEAAGYKKERDNGGHTIYAKEGCRPIPVPRHRVLDENTAKSILRTAGLL